MGPFFGFLASSWPLAGRFVASSGHFLTSSGLFLASSGPLPGLFWLCFGLFLHSPKFRNPQRRHFLFIKHCVLILYSGPLLASSWPLPGLFWPLPGLFLASSWPLPVLFWPLFGFFLDSPKSPKFTGFQRRHFLFIKHCVSSSFSPNSGFLGLSVPFCEYFLLSGLRASSGLFQASSGLFLASSGLFLASSGPLLASSWPLLAFSWPLLASFLLFPGFSI